jgi:hypothetical protein
MMGAVRDALAGWSEWSQPRRVGTNPFLMQCRLAPASTPAEIAGSWSHVRLPRTVAELWLTCREAHLFVDVEYGQCGLRVLSPAASAARSESERSRRPAALGPQDVVLGEFLGDQDLLVVDPVGRPLVASPLDGRDEWARPAGDLPGFLKGYIGAMGRKYWE